MFIAQAQHIGEMQKTFGLEMPVDVYVEQFRFGLMEVVFEWARGMVSGKSYGNFGTEMMFLFECSA